MTKNQKIWFAVFLAMFLVPEILWSDLRSYVFETLFPEKFSDFPLLFNVVQPPTNSILLFFSVIAPFIGLIGILFLALKISNKRKIIKILVLAILGVLILLEGLITWMQLYVLINAPQFG